MVELSFNELEFTTLDRWLRGYVWIMMQVILLIYVLWQTISWFPHFHKKGSPLQWVYPGMILSCVAFIINGIGNGLGGVIPIAYELGVAILGTAISFVVFAWGLIVTKVLFSLPSTRRKMLYGLVFGNIAYYILLIVISIFEYSLVIIPVLIFEAGLIILYVCVSIHMKRVMTAPQLVLINRITRMADVLCTLAFICVCAIIAFSVLIFTVKAHLVQTIFYFMSRVALVVFAGFTVFSLQKFARARVQKDQRRRSVDTGTTHSGGASGSKGKSTTSSSDDFDLTPPKDDIELAKREREMKERKAAERERRATIGAEEKEREKERKGEDLHIGVTIEVDSRTHEEFVASPDMMSSPSTKNLLGSDAV